MHSIICYLLVLHIGALVHVECAAGRQPNIIYILSDDLGHADVGFTNGNVKTPNLNKMAREGTVVIIYYIE